MGGACCKGVPPPEYNPDGSPKETQNLMQVENDPMELRRYTRDGDLIMLDKLLRRMPLAQINSSAPPDETSPIEKGWTALHYAAQANQLRALKKLMLYGAAAEAPTAMGETPLHVSLLEGRWKVAAFLLQRGAPVNRPTRRGVTPIMCAMMGGRKEFVLKFIERAGGMAAVEWNVKDKDGNSPALYAAKWGWAELLEAILDNMKIMPDPKTKQLHSYGMCKGIEAAPSASLLNTRMLEGDTVLGWVLKFACSGSIPEELGLNLVTKLREKGANFSLPAFKERIPPVLLAAASGLRSVYDFIVTKGEVPGAALLKGRDVLGRSALHYAAARGCQEICEDLMARGLMAHELDTQKNTPLHLASQRGKDSTAKLLLDKSANKVAALNTLNKHGHSVYHLALMSGCSDSAQELSLHFMDILGAAALAPVLPIGKKGPRDTPLMLAIQGHQDKVAQAMVDKNANINECNAKGETPLSRNLSNATAETAQADGAVFKMLMDKGVDVSPSKGREHPLMAVSKSPLDAFAREVVEALKAKGTLDWQQADEQGRTPLHHAAKANNAFIVRAAVKEGKCDVNAKESSGRTPLTYAAEGAATAAMKVLLNNGADPKLADKGSKTPLSWCLALDKASTLGCAAMLLYMGAKPEDCKDTTGEGLLHRAVRYGASTFIGVWSRYGGNMLLTSTTDPDADDVPGAEEAAAVSVDAMDEEWDPFEVELDEEEEEELIAEDERLWEVKTEMETMRVEIITLINEGKIQRPDEGASRKTDQKIRDSLPALKDKKGEVVLLPEDYKFSAEQWNYFKRRKARLEDPTIEESEDENSDDEELASVTPTKKSIMDKTKSMAMDFIGTVQEETGIGGDVKAEVLVLKDELCVDQVTEFKDQAMDLKDKLTSIPASWNLSDEQIALIDMMPEEIGGKSKYELLDYFKSNSDAAEAAKKKADAAGADIDTTYMGEIAIIALEVSAGPVAEGEEDEEGQLAAEADLCAPPTPAEMKLLKRMGGSWWDRFWADTKLAPPSDWVEWDVEFARQMGIKRVHAPKPSGSECGSASDDADDASSDDLNSEDGDFQTKFEWNTEDDFEFDEVDCEEAVCEVLRNIRGVNNDLLASAGYGTAGLLSAGSADAEAGQALVGISPAKAAQLLMQAQDLSLSALETASAPSGSAASAVRNMRRSGGIPAIYDPSMQAAAANNDALLQQLTAAYPAAGSADPADALSMSMAAQREDVKARFLELLNEVQEKIRSRVVMGAQDCASTDADNLPMSTPRSRGEAAALMRGANAHGAGSRAVQMLRSLKQALTPKGAGSVKGVAYHGHAAGTMVSSGPGPVAEGVVEKSGWSKQHTHDTEALKEDFVEMAEQVAVACADLFDLMITLPIAMAAQIQDKHSRRSMFWNPFAKWEDAAVSAELDKMGIVMPEAEGEKMSSEAKAALDKVMKDFSTKKIKTDFQWAPREGVVAAIQLRYHTVLKLHAATSMNALMLTRQSLKALQANKGNKREAKKALWNVLAEWVKKGDKEKFGPEPYVEREDMQGTLKWRQMQKNGALVPDQFYRRGDDGEMYHGFPKYYPEKTTPLPTEDEMEALSKEVAARVAEGAVVKEEEVFGANLRARNINYYLDSISPEELPLKAGWWKKVLRMRDNAVKGARARRPMGAKIKIRKRTAWFGLPDLPTRPELLNTSALIYAVRLGRPECVRALVNSRGIAALNLEDGWGHTAIEYAYYMHFNDRLDPVKALSVDELLVAGATITRATLPGAAGYSRAFPQFVLGLQKAAMQRQKLYTAGKPHSPLPGPNPTTNADAAVQYHMQRFCNMDRHTPMCPLIMATVAGDQPRLSWMVRKLGAPLNASWVYMPDIPTYFKGYWGNTGGRTETIALPLHLAVLTEKTDLVRLLIALGADVNRVSMHYDFDGFFVRRRYQMFKMKEDNLKELQKAQDMGVKYRKQATAAISKGKSPPPPPGGKKAPRTAAEILQASRERIMLMTMEMFNLRDKHVAEARLTIKADFAYKETGPAPGKEVAAERMQEYVAVLEELRGKVNGAAAALDAPLDNVAGAVSGLPINLEALDLGGFGIDLGDEIDGGAALGLLAKAGSGLMNMLMNPLAPVLAELKTDKLHCYLSPLHMCGRYGYEEPALVLLDNGAIITGGSLAANTTPLEEALAFARNKAVDHPRTNQPRIMLNAVKHMMGNISYPSPQVGGDWGAKDATLTVMIDRVHNFKTANFMCARVEDSGPEQALRMGPAGNRLKPQVKDFDKLRFPVAHWEPSMKCAHVLLLRRAPLNPASGQVNCMLRDIMDNGSWEWLKLDVENFDWLERATNHFMQLIEGSVGLSSQYDMPKKAKGFKNMITNFRALCELAYFREGFNAVQTKYSVKPSDLRAQHEQGMKRVAMNLEAYQRNLDAAVKTLTAQAAKVVEELAQTASAEAALYKSGFMFDEEHDEFSIEYARTNPDAKRESSKSVLGGHSSMRNSKALGRVSRSAGALMKPFPRFQLPLRLPGSSDAKASMQPLLEPTLESLQTTAEKASADTLATVAVAGASLLAGVRPGEDLLAQVSPPGVAFNKVTPEAASTAQLLLALAGPVASDAQKAAQGLLHGCNTTPEEDMTAAAESVAQIMLAYECDGNWAKAKKWYTELNKRISGDDKCLTTVW